FCCRRNAHLNRHGARTSTWRIRRALPAASQKRAQCENKRADCYSLLGAQSTPPATRFGMQIHTSSRYLGFYDTRAPGYSPAGSGAKLGCHVTRSEEHTSELQSLAYLVCRLLLEKKKKKKK